MLLTEHGAAAKVPATSHTAENNVNVFLSHIDLSVIIYGVIMFIGIAVLFIKLRYSMWVSLGFDLAVFVFVFKLHGGTQAGGFAAMIAALLAGIFLPLIWRWTKK